MLTLVVEEATLHSSAPLPKAYRAIIGRMDIRTTTKLLRALAEHEVEYVLIGGIAMNVHGFVRATEDVDLMLNPSEVNVERLRSALRSIYDDPQIGDLQAADFLGDYPVVRYFPPLDEPPIDLISRLGTAFSYGDVEWSNLVFDGVPVRVATPASLFEMKRETVRPIDREDALRLSRALEASRRVGGEED